MMALVLHNLEADQVAAMGPLERGDPTHGNCITEKETGWDCPKVHGEDLRSWFTNPSTKIEGSNLIFAMGPFSLIFSPLFWYEKKRPHHQSNTYFKKYINLFS